MDWFTNLLNNGVMAVRDVGVSNANAGAQASIAQAQIAAANTNFQQNLLLRQTTGLGAFNNNVPLMLMLGVAAFFIINQANK
jgi:hypothetical protein